MDGQRPGGCHHQLTMDLDASLCCCKLLATKLDTLLSNLDQTTDTALDVRGKMKIVLGARDIDEMEKLLARQTDTLHLLLTACNCASTAKAAPREPQDALAVLMKDSEGDAIGTDAWGRGNGFVRTRHKFKGEPFVLVHGFGPDISSMPQHLPNPNRPVSMLVFVVNLTE
ncbi:hypothetical protein CC78DRAFT_586623 [Lojkania enalia]|uniref:Uncharacterized protein n=1 Tax=Lojkania enalia TaxID=147567 RepID=A0A9P4MVC3_9PLEO|nr:hypothetical protein CC78DRAFT_586623 [Didymosphaeria enalia]